MEKTGGQPKTRRGPGTCPTQSRRISLSHIGAAACNHLRTVQAAVL